MNEVKFRIDREDEIVITLPARRRTAAGEISMRRATALRSQAMIRPARREEFMPRRLSSAGLMNFYDLARKWDQAAGRFVSLETKIIKPAEPIILSGDELTAADYAERHAQIFSVDQSEWKRVFKRIDKADAAKTGSIILSNAAQSYTLDETEANWTEAGFKLSEDIRNQGFDFFNAGRSGADDGRFFDVFSIRATDTQFYKTTKEFDYDAAAVELSLENARSVNVFLMPAFCFNYGHSARQLANSQELELIAVLNRIHLTYPRDVIFNENSPHYNKALSGTRNSIPPNAYAEALQFAAAIGGSRSWVSNGGSSPFQPAAASAFPGGGDAGAFLKFEQFAAEASTEGALLCVMNVNEEWFYVWTKEI